VLFIDNILVYSRDKEKHAQHLMIVLQTLREGLKFGFEELMFLGHVVLKGGVKVDYQKIKAIIDWPKSTNVIKVRGFLIVFGYY